MLLTTFSKALANALAQKLDRLAGNEPTVATRITVKPLGAVGYDLYTRGFGQPNIAPENLVRSLLDKAAKAADANAFPARFLASEWRDVVDAWQLASWEGYRDVPRLGRKTRLGIRQREALWAVFETLRSGLAARKVVTWADVFGRVTERIEETGERPWDFAVVDEAQDVSVPEARFLAALGGGRPEALFFAGDLGQRIFQQPFSWKALGIDVRGRSHTLTVNDRTSEQIRVAADRLLPSTLTDLDDTVESRRGTVSVFAGPEPDIERFDTPEEEIEGVAAWVRARLAAGIAPHEIGVFVRAPAQLKRARSALKAAKVDFVELDDKLAGEDGKVALSTMHLAKGLEFRAVVVMACDDAVIPLQERIETIADESDLEEVCATERHLLYVACTRAREALLVTGVDPISEFVEDLVEAH